MHNGKQKKRSRRGGGKAKQQQATNQGRQVPGTSSSAVQSVLKPTQAAFHPKQPLPAQPPKAVQAQQALEKPTGHKKTDENSGFIDVFFEHNKPTHFLFFGQSAPFVFDRQQRSLENVPPPPPLPRAAR